MAEKFVWHRMHKDEARIEREAYDCVETAILEHYEIEDVSELTKEQIAEIEHFVEEYISEYSPIRSGFSDLFDNLEL